MARSILASLLPVLVAVSSLLAVGASNLPGLPQACIDDRTAGCCPSLIKLLTLEKEGCSVSDITQAPNASSAAAFCTACGDKFSAVAAASTATTGAVCQIVQQHVSLFPFACESRGSTSNCLFSVRTALADVVADNDASAALSVDGMCGEHSCWGAYVAHMRDSQYDLEQRSVSNFFTRLGGGKVLAACTTVGSALCQPTFANYSLPALPASLEDFSPSPSGSFCSGCERVAFSTAMSMVNPVDVQYAPETMRRLTLGGCSGGCAAKFLSESEGRRALLGLSWQECSTLPSSCSANCKAFVERVQTVWGCCARYSLETSVLEIQRRGESVPYGATGVAEFIAAANQQCGTQLMQDCPAGVTPSQTFSASSEFSAALSSTDAHAARVELAQRLGVMGEDVSVQDTRGSGTIIDWEMKLHNAAATAEAGQAYTSTVHAGGLSTQVGTTAVHVSPTCPASVIPDYHFIPGQGTLTTSCETLAKTNPTVDCTTPDFEDAYGNKMWRVSAGLADGMQPCASL